jgi:hypothetical protein
MRQQPFKLFWKDRLIGRVRDAVWSDYPWVCGKVAIFHMPADLRAALEYLHQESISEEGVTDWPFAEEYLWGWRLVKPDGTSEEISQPIIAFKSGDIEWC